MKKKIPIPGDLIIVEKSEWYALSDGQRLRVCETGGWIDPNKAIYTVPRRQANTFWGPNHGFPDGIKPEYMSTSGGPFKSIPFENLDGIELVGKEVDRSGIGKIGLGPLAESIGWSRSTCVRLPLFDR